MYPRSIISKSPNCQKWNQQRSTLLYPSPLSNMSCSPSLSLAFCKVSLEVLLSSCLLSLAAPQKHHCCWMDVSGKHPPLSTFLSLEAAQSLNVLASSCHLDPDPPELRSLLRFNFGLTCYGFRRCGREDSSTFTPTLRWILEG